jgi:hypothetical protein
MATYDNDKIVDTELTGWVVNKVDNWEDARNRQHQTRWKEYYRLWRGQHGGNEDKIRQHERSKIIAPALQQAIEASVAEMEETIFHRRRWFDLDDDVREKVFEKILQDGASNIDQAALETLAADVDTSLDQVTAQLLEDFENKNVNKAISEILLNGALYGTGIGKIAVEQLPRRVPITGSAGITTDIDLVNDIHVSLIPVDPNEFVIDIAAKDINTALGAAHVYTIPQHEVIQKQDRGVWNKTDVGAYNNEEEAHPHFDIKEESYSQIEHVEIVEYHGLVPKELFDAAEKESVKDPLAEFAEEAGNVTYDDAGEMVECIVWIANRGTLLKVVRNPFIMQDRSFVTFQWDTVPNRFWGRGVAEKGYNPQKALDAELRARIDALALATYPVALVNGMMAPRNGDFTIRPGRNIIVSGPVNEAIAPFKFPGPDPQSYRQSAEFERMVTMATGSIDTAAPMGVSPQNATAGGMSMMMGAVLKRAKRTIRNMEQEFLSPLIHKIAWRYMQFDTERYPVTDYRFRVHGALGAQAREFEVAQLGQLLQTVPPGSPAYWLVLKGIIQNYNIDDKDQLTQIADSFLQQALNPQPPQPDFDQQVDMAGQQLKQQEFQLKTQQAVVDNIRKDSEVLAEADRDRGEAIWNQSEAVLNIAKAKTEQDKAEASIVLSKAKAAEALAGKPQSSSSLGTQPTEYLALVEALKDSFKDVAHTTANRINASLNNSLITLSNKQNVMSMDPLNTKLDQILKQQQQQALANADQSSINIDRGEDGRVLRIGNRPVRRGPAGELQGVD